MPLLFNSKKLSYYFLLICSAFLIATFYPFLNWFPEVNSLTAALFRFFWAAVFLSLITIYSNKSFRIEKKDILPLTTLSLIGEGLVVVGVIFSARLAGLTSSSLIISTSPFWVFLIGFILGKQKFIPLRIVGIILGIIGIATLIFSENHLSLSFDQGNLLGYLFGLGAAFGMGIMGNFIGNYSRKYGAMVTTSYVMLSSTALVAGLMLISNPSLFSQFLDPKNLFFGLYVGIVSTAISRFLRITALKEVNPSVVYIFNSLVPVFVGFFDLIFFQKTFDLLFIMGGIVILVGVYLTQKEGIEEAVKEVSPE
jgi:drug/metabolite transporter (DMT)-like permease